MSVALAEKNRGSGFDTLGPFIAKTGTSETALAMMDALNGVAARAISAPSRVVALSPPEKPSVAEKLYGSREAAKILTGQVAMHLDAEWRTHLFAALDELMDADDWDDADEPVGRESFRTFLRAILLLKPKCSPMLGVEHRGHILAAWVNARNDRLSFECLPNDVIRWMLTCTVDGDRESVAGEAVASRLPSILAAYGPDRWFGDGQEPAAA